MNYFLVSIVTIVVTYLFSRYLSDPAARLYVLDHPNQRSLHSESRPRNGGIAIISSFILGYTLIRFMVYQEIPGEAHIWSGLAILIIISFIDDKSPLPPWQRFLVQTGAVVVLLFGGLAATNLTIPGLGLFEMGWFGPIFSALFVIWMMNLYNFMDGMDGFACGMGMFGFGFFALLGWMAGDLPFFSASLILAAANMGFLSVNFPAPRARIFMGDVGSIPMGYLAAALALWGSGSGIFELWAAVMIFSPFIFDATLTLIRRGLQGKKVWIAHHSHCYQRLVQAGWSHKKTVLYEYALMLLCGVGAVVLQHAQSTAIKGAGLIMYCILYLVLAIMVYRKTAYIKWD